MKTPCCLLLLAVLAQVQTNLAAVTTDQACVDFCRGGPDGFSFPLMAWPPGMTCESTCTKEVANLKSPKPISEAAGFSNSDAPADYFAAIGVDPMALCASMCSKSGTLQNLDAAAITECAQQCTSTAASMAVDGGFQETASAPAPAPAASSSRQMTYGLVSVFAVLSMALFI